MKNCVFIDYKALIEGSLLFADKARNLAAKLEWYERENRAYTKHMEGRPNFRLAELSKPDELVERAMGAVKFALLSLNSEYHQVTGRYIVNGMIKSSDDMLVIIDQLLAI